MKKFCALMAAAFLFAATGTVSFAGDKSADPRESLDTAYAEIIRLMQANDSATFIKKYMSASTIADITDNGKIPLADVIRDSQKVAVVEPDRSKFMVHVLTVLKNTKPVFSDDGCTATIKGTDVNTKYSAAVIMTKEGKHWKYKELKLSIGK